MNCYSITRKSNLMKSNFRKLCIFSIAFLILSANVRCQTDSNTSTGFSQNSASRNASKSPLLRTIVSRFEQQKPKDNYSESQEEPKINVLSALLKHLEQRKTQMNSILPGNQLTLTLSDNTHNINIEFEPNEYTSEDRSKWNSIVELLVDSLSFVIQEAEEKGYKANSQYTISVNPQGLHAPCSG